MAPIVKYIWQFVFLILVQVLIINKVQLGTVEQYISPFIYFVFILTLPHNLPHLGIMFLAFIMGLIVDFFENTLGMHASSALVIGLLRPFFLKTLAPRDGYDTTKNPSYFTMGKTQFFSYIVISSFIYHVWFFTIEILRFTSFHVTILKAISSTIACAILVVLIQLLTVKK